MMKPIPFILVLSLLSCGGGERQLDENGLAASGNALGQFARASQLYWRGSLSASREEFNGVIYRFPGSPLADDARLAVRRIEGELGGTGEQQQDHSQPQPLRGLEVTVVGQAAGRNVIEWVSERLAARGCTVNTVFDPQAPEVTVVLHRQGFEAAAAALADSLSLWLSRPSVVEHQGGGGLIDAVAPGSGGVMVVVGTDALLDI